METKLLEKLSQITEEEKRLLAGGEINPEDYSVDGEFTVNHLRLTKSLPQITCRPHTRFAPFPAHSHNFVEMITVAKGSLTQVVDGKKILLKSGDILIMNKHVTHSVERAEFDDLGINVIMSDSFIESLLPNLHGSIFDNLIKENMRVRGNSVYMLFSAKGEVQIDNLLENLIFELTEYNGELGIINDTVALLFKYLSLKNKRLLKDYSLVYTEKEKRMAQISEYISSSYKTATLTALGKKLGLTTPYLSKLIQEYFGTCFKELLLKERLKRAYALICDSNMTVGDVISSVGYENQSYFLRCFKREFGKGPSQLRREAKEKNSRN